jgi:uncharacterized membrane protein
VRLKDWPHWSQGRVGMETSVTEMRTAFLIVAVLLFVLAAIPPVPYTGSLVALGLAFFAASHWS